MNANEIAQWICIFLSISLWFALVMARFLAEPMPPTLPTVPCGDDGDDDDGDDDWTLDEYLLRVRER
jgi:hypothetical protein